MSTLEPQPNNINADAFKADTLNSSDNYLKNDELLALRVMPMPENLNANGVIFGGWIMSQVDIAGSIIARDRAKGRVATVSVNSFSFIKSVNAGDLLSFYSKIIKTGRTSVTVGIQVYVPKNDLKIPEIKIAEAELVYVHLNEHHKPCLLPS